LAPIPSVDGGTDTPSAANRAIAANLWTATAVADAGLHTGASTASNTPANPNCVSGCSAAGSRSLLTTTSTLGSTPTVSLPVSTRRFSLLSHAGSWPSAATALQIAFVSLLLWRLNTPTRTVSLI
jgi:hypothetical protein